MKRASLPLFLLLLVAAGLALWIGTRARPSADSPAAPAPGEVHASDETRAPVLEREQAAESVRASEHAPGAKSECAASGSLDGCHVSGWVWHLVEGKKQGLENVPVQLWLAAADGTFRAESKPLAETTTGPLGSFRFSELARGRYFVGAQRSGSARHLAPVELAEAGAWETLEFTIGTARVEGLVFAQAGDTQPTLELKSIFPRGSAQQGWPGAQHRFAFEDLPAGDYELRARWRTGGASSWREEITRFELADGQLETFEVGSDGTLPRWRGRVRVAEGAAPRPEALLRFERYVPVGRYDERPSRPPAAPSTPGVTRMQDDARLCVRASLDAQGRFDVALPAREWLAVLEIEPLTHREQRLEHASLEDGDLALDLACAGSRIRGRVLGEVRPATGKLLRIVGDRTTGGDGYAYCGALVDARGEFVIDGVNPGNWEFLAQPLARGLKSEAVKLNVGAEDHVLELELQVQRP